MEKEQDVAAGLSGAGIHEGSAGGTSRPEEPGTFAYRVLRTFNVARSRHDHLGTGHVCETADPIECTGERDCVVPDGNDDG